MAKGDSLRFYLDTYTPDPVSLSGYTNHFLTVHLAPDQEEQKEVAMRRSSNWVGVLATVGLTAVMAISACKSSDQSPQAPVEKTPGLSRPAPQSNMPASPERSTGETGAPKSGY